MPRRAKPDPFDTKYAAPAAAVVLYTSLEGGLTWDQFRHVIETSTGESVFVALGGLVDVWEAVGGTAWNLSSRHGVTVSVMGGRAGGGRKLLLDLIEEIRASRVMAKDVLKQKIGTHALAADRCLKYLELAGCVSVHEIPPNPTASVSWVHGALEEFLHEHPVDHFQ